MTGIADVLMTKTGAVIQTAGFLLLMIQLYLVIASFRLRTERFFCVFSVVRLACSTLVFCILPAMYFSLVYPETSQEMTPAFVTALKGFPAAAVVLAEIISCILSVLIARRILRHYRRYPTENAIKEAIDLLPAGVCFGDASGTVVLANLRMNKLARRITGRPLTDSRRLWKAVSESGEPAVQYTMPGSDETWQFASEMIEAEGRDYAQITATDVTRQWTLTKELEEKNKKLKDIQLRLKVYNARSDELIRSQEILNARTAVHDQLGHILLTCRYYLEHPEAIDEAGLLEAMKNANYYLLIEGREDDEERDPLKDALEMARRIGVEPEITGPIPENDQHRAVLGAAVNECAANTVKHAEGDLLKVAVEEGRDRVRFTVTNNGKQPSEPVRETGGLYSLRMIAEEAGGRMEIETEPEFAVIIQMPY